MPTPFTLALVAAALGIFMWGLGRLIDSFRP